MKKIFTLIFLAMASIAVNAQVVLTDPQGKEYADGETMVILPEIDPEWEEVIFECPSIKNKGSINVSVSMEIEVTQLPEGTSFQVCYPLECTMIDKVSTITTAANNLGGGDVVPSRVEWFCANVDGDYVKGTAVAKITLYENGAKGNTVTVKFPNEDADAVETVVAGKATKIAAYNINGQQTNAAHGLLIEKMSDGSVRKVVK